MPHPTDPVLTVSECVQRFLKFHAARHLAKNTLTAFANDLQVILTVALEGRETNTVPITELDRYTLRDAFADHAQTHAASSTDRAHYTWRMFFDLLALDGIVEASPMSAVPRVKTPKRQPKPFDGWGEGFDVQLLKALASGCRHGKDPWPERDVAVVATLLTTGVRASEFCAMNIAALEGERPEQFIRVMGKGDKWRSIPVEPELDDILGEYLESRKARFPKWKMKRTDPLFLGTLNDGGTKRITARQLYHLVESALSSAGFSNRRPAGAMAHAFRHTFGTSLAAEGVGVLAIANMMGHESIATTQPYIQSVARDERAGAAKNRAYKALRQLHPHRDEADLRAQPDQSPTE